MALRSMEVNWELLVRQGSDEKSWRRIIARHSGHFIQRTQSAPGLAIALT